MTCTRAKVRWGGGLGIFVCGFAGCRPLKRQGCRRGFSSTAVASSPRVNAQQVVLHECIADRASVHRRGLLLRERSVRREVPMGSRNRLARLHRVEKLSSLLRCERNALVPQLNRRGILPAARMTQLIDQPTGVFGSVTGRSGPALMKLGNRLLLTGELAIRAFRATVLLRSPSRIVQRQYAILGQQVFDLVGLELPAVVALEHLRISETRGWWTTFSLSGCEQVARLCSGACRSPDQSSTCRQGVVQWRTRATL